MNHVKILEIEKRNLRLNDVIEKYNRTQKIIVQIINTWITLLHPFFLKNHKNERFLEKEKINSLNIAFEKFKQELLKNAKMLKFYFI